MIFREGQTNSRTINDPPIQKLRWYRILRKPIYPIGMMTIKEKFEEKRFFCEENPDLVPNLTNENTIELMIGDL